MFGNVRSGLESVYRTLLQRPDLEKLKAKNLPLRPVDWDGVLTVDELDSVLSDSRVAWPPASFQERDRRVRLYRDVWNNDLSRFVADRKVWNVAANLFRRSISDVANVLLVSPLAVDVEGLGGQMLRHLAYDTVVDMQRFGGAFIESQVDDDGMLMFRLLRPDRCYSVVGGRWLTMTTDDEAASIVLSEPDGFAREWLFEFKNDHVGRRIAGPDVSDGLRFVTVVQNTPRVPGWGVSVLDDLLPLGLQMAVQMTQGANRQNASGNPTLLITSKNLRELGALTVGQSLQPPASGPGVEAEVKRATKVARDVFLQDVAVSPGCDLDARYVERVGSDENWVKYMAELKGLFREVRLMPNLLEALQGPESGVSLRIRLLPFYAASLDLQEDARVGIEMAVNAVMDGVVSVEWRNGVEFLEQLMRSGSLDDVLMLVQSGVISVEEGRERLRRMSDVWDSVLVEQMAPAVSQPPLMGDGVVG